MDAKECNIVDLFVSKSWGMKFATTAACTVLRVDQVCYPFLTGYLQDLV